MEKTKMTTLGPYTIREGLRPDNPAFPCYLVFRGAKLIGRQFSMPSLTDCEWLEANREGRYAEPTGASMAQKSKYALAGGEATARKYRRGRPTNEERAQREAQELEELSAE